MHRARTGVLVTAFVLASACTSGDAAPNTDPSPSETASTSPSPTPTSEPPAESPSPTESTPADAFTVPDEITVDYLNLVMDEIDRVYADAFRTAKAAGRAEDASVVELLSTVYEPSTALGNAQTFDEFVGVDLLADDIQPPETNVSEVLDETDSCVMLRASVDLTPLVKPEANVQPSDAHHIQLVRAEEGSAGQLPWRVAYSSALSENPPQTCADADRVRQEGEQ